MATYWVTNNGGGNGLSQGSPTTLANVWSLVGPGDTVFLLSATYQGDNNMLHPPANLAGTSGAPIRVAAFDESNPATVPLFDGQFVRNPVRLYKNSWFILEGFNVKNGETSLVQITTGSHRNIVRRVVMWDCAWNTNSGLCGVNFGSTNNLIEDCAGFGVARKGGAAFGHTVYGIDGVPGTNNGQNIIRRWWSMGHGSGEDGVGGPEILYNSYGDMFENVLATFDWRYGAESFTRTSNGNPIDNNGGNYITHNPAGIITAARLDPVNKCSNCKIYGSLAYLRRQSIVHLANTSLVTVLNMNGWGSDCITIRDSMGFVEPENDRFTNTAAITLGPPDPNYGTTGAGHSARNLTCVSGRGIVAAATWGVTASSSGQSISQVPSPWSATTTGANLCYRYVNGVKTTEPLWPWPMNERIKAATAMAGVYSGPCLGCSGGRIARTAIDVTADMEAMFGPIPAQCRALSVTGNQYYASPSGGGDGLSTGSPFRISDFLALPPQPGDTLNLLDGTYTGANSMITPSSSIDGSGLSSSWPPPDEQNVPGSLPITVRALNEGQVLIDGQFLRDPISLSGNAWWVIQGINAKNGERVVIRMGEGSNFCIVRRCIFWDVSIAGNTHVTGPTSSNNILFEDCAAFGTGRKTLGPTQGVSGIIHRRCWSRFEGSLSSGPMGASLVYNGVGYLWENLLATWDAKQMPDSYNVHDSWPPTNIGVRCGPGGTGQCPQAGQTFGVGKAAAGVERMDGNLSTQSRVRGSLAYIKATDKITFNHAWAHQNQGLGGFSDVSLEDVFGYVDPGNPRYRHPDGLTLAGKYQNPFSGGQNLTGNRLTHIGGMSVESQWVLANNFSADNLAEVVAAGRNPWTTLTGAGLCYRYVNGNRTTVPLWSWPMNERIKQATASAGTYSGPCPTCSGGFATPRTATDVTAEIQQLLGPIPPECRGTSGGVDPVVTLYYASPTGTGDGKSQASPFKISDFLAMQPSPGYVLNLLDGTYTGDEGMITPSAGLSGTPTLPITIRALNDGSVTIDGQHARIPVHLADDNAHWVLEGFNAKRGTSVVVGIYSGSHNNVVRRVVAWDAAINDDNAVWDVVDSIGNLFEDIGGFGTGKRIFKSSQRGNQTTVRRAWFRWEGSTEVGPGTFLTTFNNQDLLAENVLLTWSGESMPEEFDVTQDGVTTGEHRTNFSPKSPAQLIEAGVPSGGTRCTETRLLGSIGYINQADKYPAAHQLLRSGEVNCYTIQDVVAAIDPGNAVFNSVYGFLLEDASWGTPNNVHAAHITSLRGVRGDSITSEWGPQHFSFGSALGDVLSPWSTEGEGARMCYRYLDGAQTTIPLWPWTMNDRIRAATASAGAYTGPCPGCVGGRAVRTETNVMAQLQALLGTIPASCRQLPQSQSLTIQNIGGGGSVAWTATIEQPGSFLTDDESHPPPTTGDYPLYNTYGAFGPNQPGFPDVGEGFTDPIFGNGIRRLTNELGQESDSELYGRNAYFNASGTRMHHRAADGTHDIIDVTTGEVVRANTTFNADSSFSPTDPDIWYHFDYGTPDLKQFSIETGLGTTIKTFGGNLEALGGSVDNIDRTGRYFVLKIGGSFRVWDRLTDTLYSGSISGSFGAGGGWVGISPDGNYVLASTPGSPPQHHSFLIDHDTQSVDTGGVLYWTLSASHGDPISPSDGKTYLITKDDHTTGNVYRVDVTLPQTHVGHEQQRSQNLHLLDLAISLDDAHFCCAGDWAYISVESGDDTFGATIDTWRPYKQEIVMVNVLTRAVRRLAHHRSRSTPVDYWYQPKVDVPWGGNIVVWQSNFGHEALHYGDIYALTVGDGGETPTWLSLSQYSGVTPATIQVSVNPSGLVPGVYQDTITVTIPGDSATCEVTLTVQ